MVQVAVIGGGFGGLLAGVELKRRGVDVLVMEGTAHPGGVARTVTEEGYVFEPGAGTLLLPHPHLTPLLDETAARMVPTDPSANRRYVYTGGKLVEVPASPKLVAAPLVPFGAKLRAAAEPFVGARSDEEDETLAAFMRRRLGKGVGGLIAAVMAGGIHAGDPDRLSARATFPTMVTLEDEAGSIVKGGLGRMKNRDKGRVRPHSHVPPGGMGELADHLAGWLGESYRASFPVASTRRENGEWVVEGPETVRARNLVVTVRPEQAADLLDDELAALLQRIPSAPVVVLGLGGPTSSMSLPAGFGYLSGPDAGLVGIGCLFESSYAPGRAPTGHSLAKVIAGGARRPEVIDWDDDRLVAVVGGEVARVLGTDIEASFVRIVRHRPGIPQYNLGHLDWLHQVDELAARRPGLHLGGWGYRGIGVSHLAADSHRLGNVIAPRAAA